MIGEPPRTPYDLHFSVLGIPVRVHPLFWAVAVLLGYTLGDLAQLLLWVITVFVSILVHELGHALLMRYYGAQPWITLYSFGGLASYNSHMRHNTWRDVLISLAGPGAGFLFAGVICLGILASGHQVSFARSILFIHFEPYANRVLLNNFLFFLLYINIFWGLFNLIPLYPLDGGQVSRSLFLHFSRYNGIRYSLILSIATGGIVALLSLSNRQFYIAIMCGYLAYSSFTTLQAYQGRGGSGGW